MLRKQLRILNFFIIILTSVNAVMAELLVSDLHFDKPNYNFGVIKEGEIVKHSFVFHNQGKGNLVINKVVTSCGCISSLNNTKTTAPEETGQIAVAFNSAGFSGAIKNKIIVYSNDYDQTITSIYMNGEVMPDISKVNKSSN